MSDHPVRLRFDDDLKRSRLTVFFRLLLALPHLFWLVLWTLGVVVLAILAWVVALVRGRLPDGLHDFFAMYVRYITHLGAYLTIAANPYPGFTGAPGYPVDVEIPAAERQSRLTIGFRIFLALPALLLSSVLGWTFSGGGGGGQTGEDAGELWWTSGFAGVAAVCGFLGWFASVARGRMPGGLRDLANYGIGYSAQATAYGLLLTERYPKSDPETIGPGWSLSTHPVRLELADDGRRSRLTVAFRLLLALPHLVWLMLWTIAAFFAAIANGIVALIRGRSADPLHRFLGAYVRYTAHVTAFTLLIGNPFPGFAGAAGYPVDVTIGPRESQNRWVTLFRTVLVIPALIVSGGLSLALLVVGVLGWFAALATGRMPTGLRNLGAISVRYLAQTNAYWFVVTDSYPYASPSLHSQPLHPLVEAEI